MASSVNVHTWCKDTHSGKPLIYIKYIYFDLSILNVLNYFWSVSLLRLLFYKKKSSTNIIIKTSIHPLHSIFIIIQRRVRFLEKTTSTLGSVQLSFYMRLSLTTMLHYNRLKLYYIIFLVNSSFSLLDK